MKKNAMQTDQIESSQKQSTSLGLSENKPNYSNTEEQAYKIIDGTPFYVGRLSDGQFVVACGNTRMQDTFRTQEEAVMYVEGFEFPWELTGMFMESIIKQIINQNKGDK